MKSFKEYATMEKPVYVRRENELSYDLSDDVFKPGLNKKDNREALLVKLKSLRNAALPDGWKGMTS
jgi:hypothetical protein